MWMEIIKKLTFIHDRLALEMNKFLQRAHVPEWMTKRKDHIDTKGPKQRNRPIQLQTHNLPSKHKQMSKNAIKLHMVVI